MYILNIAILALIVVTFVWTAQHLINFYRINKPISKKFKIACIQYQTLSFMFNMKCIQYQTLSFMFNIKYEENGIEYIVPGYVRHDSDNNTYWLVFLTEEKREIIIDKKLNLPHLIMHYNEFMDAFDKAYLNNPIVLDNVTKDDNGLYGLITSYELIEYENTGIIMPDINIMLLKIYTRKDGKYYSIHKRTKKHIVFDKNVVDDKLLQYIV